MADSEQLGMIRLALGGVTKLNLTQPPAPVSGSPDAHVADQPRKRTKKNWEDLLIRDQIVWLIKALELRATSTNGHWHNGEWEKLLKEDFGHYDKKLGASLRAALARTSGKFREMFISRIEKEFGADAKPYLDRLAKIQ